jgi:hypothetical protein
VRDDLEHHRRLGVLRGVLEEAREELLAAAEECCHPLAVRTAPSTADELTDIVPLMTARWERRSARLAWGIGLCSAGLLVVSVVMSGRLSIRGA